MTTNVLDRHEAMSAAQQELSAAQEEYRKANQNRIRIERQWEKTQTACMYERLEEAMDVEAAAFDRLDSALEEIQAAQRA